MVGKPATSRRVGEGETLTAARAEEISNAKIINRVTRATISGELTERHEKQSLVDFFDRSFLDT
jgi:hypothetical protein